MPSSWVRSAWISSMVMVSVSPFGVVTTQRPGSSVIRHGGFIQLRGL